MKDLVQLSAFAICLLLTALVYFIAELAVSGGYASTITYVTAALWLVCSWLVLSLLFYEPEYFVAGLWTLAFLGWGSVYRVLESPDPDSITALMSHANRHVRHAIEAGSLALLIVAATFYYIRRRRR